MGRFEDLAKGARPIQVKDKKFLRKIRIAACESVTIMPCSSATPESLRVTRKSIQTHKKTCDSHLIAFDNSSDCMGNRMALRKFVESQGYTYRYISWPFSLTGIYNLGTLATNSKFVVHSTADVTYFPGWLDEIKTMWKKHGDEYQSFHPYSKPTKGLEGSQWRDEPGEGVQYVYDPLCHVNVFHRPKTYYWDEALPWWESDVDYWIWCHYHRLKPGLCLGSRVDTQVRGIMEEAHKSVERSHLNTMCAWTHIRLKWMGYHHYIDDDMSKILGIV